MGIYSHTDYAAEASLANLFLNNPTQLHNPTTLRIQHGRPDA